MRDPTPRPRLAFGRRWPTTIASAALLLAAGAWQTAAAQETAGAVDLRLRIVAESSGDPVPDASVSLLAEDSVLVDHAISDGEGRAPLKAPPGTYRIRVERMDLEPWTSEPLTVERGDSQERTIRILVRPVPLPGLDVETEGGRCPGTREERRRGYERYQEVVQALGPIDRLEASDQFVFQVRTREEIFRQKSYWDGLYSPAPTRSMLLPRPIATLDPDSLARRGYIRPGEGASLQYYPPTAGTVVSDAFARTHCFRAVEGEGGDRRGLGFQPLPGREIPDVKGEVWLDADAGAPLELEYTYTGLNRILRRYELPRIIADLRRRDNASIPGRRDRMNLLVWSDTKIDEDLFGGRLTFARISEVESITHRWRIRMPILVDQSSWHSNWRTGRPSEIRLKVAGVPLERRGTVEGVARVRGDSDTSEGAEGGG